MGKIAGKIPTKAESVTPDEKKNLLLLQADIAETEKTAAAALLTHDEAKTEFSYALLTLRRKYALRVGDSIDPNTGRITRA